MTGQLTNRVALEALARRYLLRLPDRQNVSRMGELAGKRTGSSIEYQDRKDYVPGDEIRHIDWRAYARNDRLTIKMYREEICPTIDILLDMSHSMASTPEKSQRSVEMCYFFHLLGMKLHATMRIYALGRRLDRVNNPIQLVDGTRDRVDSPMDMLHAAPMLRRSGIKIFISDFLFPFDPSELHSIYKSADHIVFVQVLSDFENNPREGGRIRLVDAENQSFIDLSLNKVTIQGYKDRLGRLRSDLERRLRAGAGAFASMTDEMDLEDAMTMLSRGTVIEV